jgi:hypothetical protein
MAAKDGNGNTSVAVTLGTDTSIITDVAWMYPVPYAAAPTPEAVCVTALGRSPTFKGEAAKNHNVFAIGGYGRAKGRVFTFGIPISVGRKRESLVWELTKTVLSGGDTTAKITYATSLTLVKRAFFVIPWEIVAAAPATTGVGVTEITTIDASFKTTANKTFACLWGGYPEPAAATDGDLAQGYQFPYLLKARGSYPRRPGEWIAEIVTKAFTSASPSTATITAASDCEVIRHIEFVIPVSGKSTAQAVAWDGGTGASCVIYTANTQNNDVYCLVVGR